ncbi:hypothetical protein BDZ88DRAFT_451160 [Geranomyces variabilis]|nr:hypothetical protein BDZ88DRAFT_451160 [Geranomyces variabilis]KAJ3141095.1 hypothetical protein HDU90_007119 [Geranomyces variabilis]
MLVSVKFSLFFLVLFCAVGALAAPSQASSDLSKRDWIEDIWNRIFGHKTHTTTTAPPTRTQTPPAHATTAAHVPAVTTPPAKPGATTTTARTNAPTTPTHAPPTPPSQPADPNAQGDLDPKTELAPLARLEARMGKFNRVFDTLPVKGAAASIPWPSTYWPSYLDGANYRWQGSNQLSPIEKYAKAFSWNAQQLADQVSYQHGIDSAKSAKTCFTDWQCGGGAKCVGRRGTGIFGKRYCVATWEGICDGWTGAALMLPEPKCSVTGPKGVQFTVGDLKGLMSSYFAAENGKHTSEISMSARCNTASPRKDANGYYTDATCNDATAGMLHIFVTNWFQKSKTGFAFDRDTTAQVWNQPVYGYSVKSSKDVTKSQALSLLGQSFHIDSRTTRIVRVQTEINWVSETSHWADLSLPTSEIADDVLDATTYNYLLFLDNNGEIIGGEYFGNSKNDQPDFFWAPFAVEQNGVAYTAIAYQELLALWNKSVACN